MTTLILVLWSIDFGCKLIWERDASLSIEAATRLKKGKEIERNFYATTKTGFGFCLQSSTFPFLLRRSISPLMLPSYAHILSTSIRRGSTCIQTHRANSFERDQIYFNSCCDNMRFALRLTSWLLFLVFTNRFGVCVAQEEKIMKW